MRVSAMLIAVPLVIAAPRSLVAQGDIRLGLAGGISIPIRAYNDLVDKGWLGAASLTFFPAASASIGFRLEGIYARNSIAFTDGRQTQVGGTGNLVFQFGARRSPNRIYVFGGGGFIRTQTSGPGFGTVETTDPALNLGAGISFGARAFAFFGEARYVSVYTDGTKPQYAPIMAGISFGGL